MDGLGERLTKSKGLFILKGDTANLFIFVKVCIQLEQSQSMSD